METSVFVIRGKHGTASTIPTDIANSMLRQGLGLKPVDDSEITDILMKVIVTNPVYWPDMRCPDEWLKEMGLAPA